MDLGDEDINFNDNDENMIPNDGELDEQERNELTIIYNKYNI